MSETNKNPKQNGTSAVGDFVRGHANQAAHAASEASQECSNYLVAQPAKDLLGLAKDYARDKPDVAALWCFGLGLFVGWKLRP
ncbi:hypothetical protein [Rosistilla oblonga]|uniref:hypothetical protein n=1 Tax=Rosistilla oblonga TaxID=2527990 RepID=UPI003A9764C0